MKKKLFIDYDDTCVGTSDVVVKFIFDEFGKVITRKDIQWWSYLQDTFGVEAEQLWEVPGMYDHVFPLPGVLEFLEELKTEYEPIIITASFGLMEEEKTIHAKKHFDLPIIHANDKWEYTRGCILIDDGPHNIEAHILKNQNWGILFNIDGGNGWTKTALESEFLHKATSYQDMLKLLL